MAIDDIYYTDGSLNCIPWHSFSTSQDDLADLILSYDILETSILMNRDFKTPGFAGLVATLNTGVMI